ncbi:hypothetical protein [Sphingomonas sp. DT-204]|uniref:hypothetical protein n=1 Tax=Sphingomonas sp. DT-204 TaxID=3396166 RepID=UPI003F1A6AF1
MNGDLPKYARIERERRFLIDSEALPPLAPPTAIEDRYIDNTRLRLRCMTPQGGSPVYKLTKKYGGDPDPIVTAYLTAEEFAVFSTLPAARLVKDRHRASIDGWCFAIDRFGGPLTGLWLAEIDNAPDAPIPGWARREVTRDPAFTGAALARDPAGAIERSSRRR